MILPKLAVLWGEDQPCCARPADRSLVAEDRSAAGVRDRTGPKAPMPTRLLTGRAATSGTSEYRTRRRCGIRPARRPGRGEESTGCCTAWATWQVPKGGWARRPTPVGPVKADRLSASGRSGLWPPSKTS
jgi:hypothetical protein